MTQEEKKQAIREEMDHYRSLNPQERGRLLAMAMRFCLRAGLITDEEQERMSRDKEFMRNLALESLIRRKLFLLAHPDE